MYLYLFLFFFFSGTVYNLTLKLTNTTYDDNLATAHTSQFSKLRMDFEVGVSVFKLYKWRQRGRVVQGVGVVILISRVQGLLPATSGICFSVVPSSNPRSRFVNSQLVCLLPVGIFNCVTFI